VVLAVVRPLLAVVRPLLLGRPTVPVLAAVLAAGRARRWQALLPQAQSSARREGPLGAPPQRKIRRR
jgi:hypothetical protein